MKLFVTFDCPKFDRKFKIKKFKRTCGINSCSNCLALEKLIELVFSQHSKDYWNFKAEILFEENGMNI